MSFQVWSVMRLLGRVPCCQWGEGYDVDWESRLTFSFISLFFRPTSRSILQCFILPQFSCCFNDTHNNDVRSKHLLPLSHPCSPRVIIGPGVAKILQWRRRHRMPALWYADFLLPNSVMIHLSTLTVMVPVMGSHTFSDLPLAHAGWGVTHMSDAWKEYMLTHYELKKPDRKPRCSQWVLSRWWFCSLINLSGVAWCSISLSIHPVVVILIIVKVTGVFSSRLPVIGIHGGSSNVDHANLITSDWLTKPKGRQGNWSQ